MSLVLLIMSFVKSSFSFLFCFIFTNILRTPLYMLVPKIFSLVFFVPASTLEAHILCNIEFQLMFSYVVLFVLFIPTFCSSYFIYMNLFFSLVFFVPASTSEAFIAQNIEFQLMFSNAFLFVSFILTC
jgi:hypothetical protein